jgi:hypothetical protein
MSGRSVSAAGALATAAAVLAVVGGLLTLDSPSRARQRKLDHLRVEDLSHLAMLVDGYWAKHAALPASIDTLVQAGELDHVLRDPKSGAPYTYLVSGERSYRLCATFALPSDSTDEAAYQTENIVFVMGSGGTQVARKAHSWRHGAGESCFDLVPPPKDTK